MELGPGVPTPAIALSGGPAAATSRRRGSRVGITESVLRQLRAVCEDVTDDPAVLGEASRDWWPLAMTWALRGEVASRAAAVARPTTPQEVADLLETCNRWGVPVTAAAGRSGVLGGSVPVFGGVVLDMCGLRGIRDVDDTSLVVDVLPGTFGDHFEHALRTEHGLTCGHWPQSMTLSTVGGWVACRGAGQLSTRYGKIEDMVVGLDVALADGRQITTGGFPRSATGPDLTQLFVGSEGTLGIVTGARLKVHPAPVDERRGAWSFDSFTDGLDVCRRILRRGATPAVLRLYDAVESERNYHLGDDRSILLVLDEGDPAITDGVLRVVADEAAATPSVELDHDLLDTWLAKRNDVAALEALISRGFVVDTMEVSGAWSRLPGLFDTVLAAISAVPGVLSASAHCSHSYLDGGCLYFTFAAQPTASDGSDAPSAANVDALYRALWDAGTEAVLAGGGSLSHHHGVGLNRSRFVAEALGGGLDVFRSMKTALDPKGILNPGKLGLKSAFGNTGLL
jgi:alkyldihydroxyacetonephosphate synthase